MSSRRARLFNAMLKVALKTAWTSRTTVADIRRLVRRFDRIFGAGKTRASVVGVDAAGVKCQWIKADGVDDSRVLFYIHGGGFAVHLPRLYGKVAAQLSKQFDAAVLLIDYRLAPEYPFPAAPDDCLAVYEWLLNRHSIEPGQLIIAGDSAGGQLALATMLMAKAAGFPMPAAAWLLSPAVKCDWDDDTRQRFAEVDDPMFNQHSLDLMTHYFVDADRSDFRISPINGDLTGLPPILIESGELEFLSDQPELFASKARMAGVDVEAKVWPGVPHVFQLFNFLPEARLARDEALAFIKARVA